MKSFATRRMWVKRIRNTFVAFRFVGIIFLPIIWVYRFFKWYAGRIADRDVDSIIGGSLAIAAACFVAVTTAYTLKMDSIASADEIIALRKADSCFDDTIVRRAAKLDRALTVRDVVRTTSDCKEFWEKQHQMKSQAEALANQLRQPKN